MLNPLNLKHLNSIDDHQADMITLNLEDAIAPTRKKEALHNIIKHAKATEAELNFVVKNNVLSVVIHDNGIGMPQGELNRFGNGIKNMRNRMTSILGNMRIENHQGTKITLSLPV